MEEVGQEKAGEPDSIKASLVESYENQLPAIVVSSQISQARITVHEKWRSSAAFMREFEVYAERQLTSDADITFPSDPAS